MRVISIINQKGGVGKSTTAASIGSAFIAKGEKVLFIDMDGQGNLSFWMNADTTKKTVFDILTKQSQTIQTIQHLEKADIIPSSPALAMADNMITETGKEYRLKEALSDISGYDLAIIDTPPAIGILSINALTASNGAIIPAQADLFSLQGIGQLNSTIETVKKYCNPSLSIYGIVLTRYVGRTVITRDISKMMESTAQQLNTKLYTTRIRECTALKEAQAMKQDIFTYAPRSNAAIDYNALTAEIEKEW